MDQIVAPQSADDAAGLRFRALPGTLYVVATPLGNLRDVSLDGIRGPEDERQFGTLLAQEAPSPEDLVGGFEEEGQRHTGLLDALHRLDPRERAIIKARHMGAQPATLSALGKKFSVSRERVRQLELRAISKLRALVDCHPAQAVG